MTITREPKWDELVFLPSIFDPNACITFLQLILIETNCYYQYPCQHKNIKIAIKMYENSMLNSDNKVFIASGNIISHKEVLEYGLPVWGEVSTMLSPNLNCPLLVQDNSYYQFPQKSLYPFFL